MKKRVLIVEDQLLIAMSIEDAVRELGHEVRAIVASKKDFQAVGGPVDIALVDVNLLDGPTGPDMASELAANGCNVVFMTANPEMVESHAGGALGVISKPVRDLDLVTAIEFAAARCNGISAPPPKTMKMFR